MAEAKSTFIPRAIPLSETDEVSLEGYGWRTYTLNTECGILAVSELRHCRTVEGSAAALEAYGLLKQAWLPGLPGNNTVRQTVVFAPSGTWLIHGNRRGSRLPYPFVVIVRASANQYVVEQNYTDEERSIMEAFYDEQWERKKVEAKEKAKAETEGSCPAGWPKTALEWKRARLGDIDFLLRWLLEDEPLAGALGNRFRFNDSTQRQIMARVEELRSAILGGGVVDRQSKGDGNVIYLPAPVRRPAPPA